MELKLKKVIPNDFFSNENFFAKGGVSRTHVKGIPNTRFLVSLNHIHERSASFEILDISKQMNSHKIYTFEETHGSNFSITKSY